MFDLILATLVSIVYNSSMYLCSVLLALYLFMRIEFAYSVFQFLHNHFFFSFMPEKVGPKSSSFFKVTCENYSLSVQISLPLGWIRKLEGWWCFSI